MKEKSECRYGARNELFCGVVLVPTVFRRAERAHSSPFGRDARCEQISVRSGVFPGGETAMVHSQGVAGRAESA